MRAPFFAAALVAWCATSVLADQSLPSLIPAAGTRVHLRIAQTIQGVDVPRTITADVTVQRKSGGAVLLEWKDPSGQTNDSVLLATADGRLELAAAERAASSDANVRALLPILNAGLAVTQGGPPAWNASLALPAGPRGTTTIVVPMRALNVAGTDYDLQGSTTSQQGFAPSGNEQGRPPGGFGGPGGGGGPGGAGGPRGVGGPGGGGGRGGFGGPGGGFGGGQPGARSDSGSAPSGMTLLVRIDGHVSNGSVHHLTIAQTRAIQIGGAPFVNVSSWTIDVVD